MDLGRLAQAIVTRARERHGFVTKTKLVKYSYVFDVEHYRRTGTMLTGFTWVFHPYGPWAREFEDRYAVLRQRGELHVRPGTRPDLEVEFLETPEAVDLAELVADPLLELAFRRIVDEWADRRR